MSRTKRATAVKRKKVPAPSRLYEPAWKEIKSLAEAKSLDFVRLGAHRALHPRIIKAITKEKWMDLGYKLELSEKKRRAELIFVREQSVLKVRMVISFNMRDIDLNDL